MCLFMSACLCIYIHMYMVCVSPGKLRKENNSFLSTRGADYAEGGPPRLGGGRVVKKGGECKGRFGWGGEGVGW